MTGGLMIGRKQRDGKREDGIGEGKMKDNN